MPLPFIQSYTDAKIEKAYRLYMGGATQRQVLRKVKGLAQRTLARRCKDDGWEAERRGRAAAEESPNVAAVAASEATMAAAAAKPTETQAPESRLVGMERMLGQQQRIAGLLSDALRKDIDGTVTAAEGAGKSLSRSQIVQLANLANNVFTLERKAWGVPDKLETKDTTPKPVDPIRSMTDEELDRRDRELAQQLAASTGRARPDRTGEAAPERVH